MKKLKTILIFSLFLCLLEKLYAYTSFPIKIIKTAQDLKLGNIMQKMKQKSMNAIKKLEKLNLNNDSSKNETGRIYMESEFLFAIHLKIGSKKKVFRMLMDTGSYVMWVIVEPKNIYDYLNYNIYIPSDSTTSVKTKNNFNIQYGTGSCSGYYYNDIIEYLENEKCTMMFGGAEQYVWGLDDCDGLIGLGFDYSSEKYGESESFIQTFYTNGITDSNLFSIKFEKSPNSEEYLKSDGQFIFGRHEDFDKNGAVSIDLVTNGYAKYYWTGEMTQFTIFNTNLTIKTQKTIDVIFDTGTNFIILPYEYLKPINDSINSFGCEIIKEKDDDNNEDDDTYLIVCIKSDYLPSFKFDIGGYSFTIPSNYSFAYHTNDDFPNFCYTSILFTKNTDSLYVIGSIFYPLFHTLFDKNNKKLSFYTDDLSLIGVGDKVENDGNDSLEPWEIALIVLFSLIGVLLIVLIVLCCLEYKKKKKIKTANDNKENDIDEKLDDNLNDNIDTGKDYLTLPSVQQNSDEKLIPNE